MDVVVFADDPGHRLRPTQVARALAEQGYRVRSLSVINSTTGMTATYRDENEVD